MYHCLAGCAHRANKHARLRECDNIIRAVQPSCFQNNASRLCPSDAEHEAAIGLEWGWNLLYLGKGAITAVITSLTPFSRTWMKSWYCYHH